MKKRILAVICLVLVSAFALASCGGPEECEHTFSEAWASDATNHWHAATCEHGEIKDALAVHVDADEDGKCDVCAYNASHFHTFASEWTTDDDSHWKTATCTHSEERSELGLHADDDSNGKCDVCNAHVHTLDGAGFCTACDKEIKPVDESDLLSVINATTARTHNVVSGTVKDYAISRFADSSKDLIYEHVINYLRGTNGTYVKWEYDEVEAIVDENGDDVAVKTGKTEVFEKWIEIVNAEEVKGISAISVDGVYKSAEPNAFGLDDLVGYYFAVSTLADGFGPEATLLALYEAYLQYGIDADGDEVNDAEIVNDSENNEYIFNFNAFVANKVTTEGVETNEYGVFYYEVSVSFTYADDYTLTSLDIQCDCYTNDAGVMPDGTPYETDIDYNYETGAFTFLETAIPDTYKFSVTQTKGTREEIELNDGQMFKPTGFEIYADAEHTTPISDSITISIADVNQEFYLVATPADRYLAFIAFEFEAVVTDMDGNPTDGLMVVIYGYDLLQVFPSKAGEYMVTFSAVGQTETMKITVEAPEVKGENTFDVEVTEANGWSEFWNDGEGVSYVFVAEKGGKYTFYLPANFGIVKVGDERPQYDPFAPGYNAEAEHSITVTLRPGQKYEFYYGATAKGTYTIGYDVE